MEVTLALFLLIIYQDYVLRTPIYLMKERRSTWKNTNNLFLSFPLSLSLSLSLTLPHSLSLKVKITKQRKKGGEKNWTTWSIAQDRDA